MNSRQIFLRFLASLGVVLLASIVLLPRRYNFAYPATVGPVFEPGVKGEHIHGIEKSKPDIVLIGDSVLYEGVDPVLFAEGLGMPVYEMATPGSGTAAWYLQLKNIVIETTHHPKYVFIFFRNTMLTVPQYRTTGRYFALLDDYATQNEPLVSQLAFINQMSPLELIAERFIPLYTARVEIRDDLDNALRYIPSSYILNCNRECTQEAISSIFGREVDPVALNLVQEDASKTLYAQEELDFASQIDESLLPHMIEIAQKANVKLVFVRTRVFGPEPEMSSYQDALDAYLTGQDGVILLDFWQDPRIIEEYYVDSLHMNALGKKEFTNILAEEFKAILLK